MVLKGLDLVLFWIAWAFGGSLVWQILTHETSIDMIKTAIIVILLAGLYETTIKTWLEANK